MYVMGGINIMVRIKNTYLYVGGVLRLIFNRWVQTPNNDFFFRLVAMFRILETEAVTDISLIAYACLSVSNIKQVY